MLSACVSVVGMYVYDMLHNTLIGCGFTQVRTDKGKGQYDEEVNVEVLEVTKVGLKLKIDMQYQDMYRLYTCTHT